MSSLSDVGQSRWFVWLNFVCFVALSLWGLRSLGTFPVWASVYEPEHTLAHVYFSIPSLAIVLVLWHMFFIHSFTHIYHAPRCVFCAKLWRYTANKPQPRNSHSLVRKIYWELDEAEWPTEKITLFSFSFDSPQRNEKHSNLPGEKARLCVLDVLTFLIPKRFVCF